MSAQWRDQSAIEAYPFKPGLPKSSGQGQISDRDFLDFHAVALGSVWLRSLEISSSGFSGWFETSTGETLSFEGTGFDGGTFPLTSSLGGIRGTVVLSGTDLFATLPAGTHLFTSGLVEVIGSLISPPPPGVSAISIDGTTKAFGVIRLEAGEGVTFGYSEGEGEYEVRIHADGAVNDDECGAGVAIRSINLVTPGVDGGILISESSAEVPGSDLASRQIFRTYPSQNGIKVQLVDQNA